VRATVEIDERISFWRSVKIGLPLLALILGDCISFDKFTTEGSGGLFINFETYRLVVFGGLYLASAWLIYLRRADFYSLMEGHWSYIFFLLFAFSSILWTANPLKNLVVCAHLLGHYFIAVAWLLLFRGHEVTLIRLYCMFSYFFIPACLVTALFFPGRNIHEPTGRWMALTWNPNSLGSLTMICIWANISYFFYAERKLMRLWILITIPAGFVLLFGAGSVTSLGLTSLVIILVPLFYWFANSRNVVSAALKIAYSSIISFGIAGYFYATQPELFEAKKILGSVGRDARLTGRADLWDIAWKAIAERPFLGWSYDNLASLPSRFSIEYHQFHNGYLDLWVRGGLISLGFLLYFAASTGVRVIRLAPSNKKLAAAYGALLVIIMLQNISEATFATGPNPLWLLFTFLYVGVSPRIVKWYETGVLEKMKWGRNVIEKQPLAEAEVAGSLQPVSRLYGGHKARRRLEI
jgi:O-antigen ligase